MRIIIALFIFFLSIKGFSQSGNEIQDLINSSIENHLASIEKLIEKKAIAVDCLDRITIMNNNMADSFKFSEKLQKKYNLIFLNYQNFSRSDLRKGITTLQLYPVVLKGDTMLITIGNVGFSKKGKKTFLSYGSLDTTSKYTYSCDMKQWVLVKIEEKGL
ncbi:MAG: hypothetical protein COZ75_07270 [Flavobacteriaceae bacterium CG_4_8_14_3_um_filter_34_10]|nr:hypothetical protein [Flavobacteriia bacterium]OIP51587.1 MAG: hypothetical protein AUK33_03985 [Flavobacteriaceae bacterium CG2_30_34_30]PIV48637.1 MAG: hypothetical protein COS19_12760 [Flavobacteriaceae bacterium CG02_land_8_20_14_3_00_34_13]PIX09347.1 MAG: hypothetical protein COZ75_07270 [Flavobacteriaceae bacterium CG_4_8_14_3_um_filter_34_10]